MSSKDQRLIQVLSIVAVAAVFAAVGGALLGTSRPLGIVLIVVGIVVLQAAWIPARRRQVDTPTSSDEAAPG
jgi:hypothetical protein